MFYVIEQKSETELIAKFGNNKVVRLVHETDGDASAYVEGIRIYGGYGETWDFPHGDDKADAIAKAEQRFRDVVTAIAEDKPLNLSDFVIKPTKPKATATKKPPTEKPSE